LSLQEGWHQLSRRTAIGGLQMQYGEYIWLPSNEGASAGEESM
jgi:hypothetical protein